MSQWTLFSNHGHVLVVLSRDPDARLRDVAQVVGITERAVQKIVRDLQDGGMISVEKQGRRNRYQLHGDTPMRHALEEHCSCGELLALMNAEFVDARLSERLAEERSDRLSPSVTTRVEVARAETEPPPKPVAESEPTPAAEPESEAESLVEQELQSEPGPKPDPQPESDPPTPKKKKRPRKKPAEDESADQGSLF